ncbi:hypothetical protein JZ751_007424, partial [Albula glossodonta]
MGIQEEKKKRKEPRGWKRTRLPVCHMGNGEMFHRWIFRISLRHASCTISSLSNSHLFPCSFIIIILLFCSPPSARFGAPLHLSPGGYPA